MKILVFGAGAIGSFFGGLLSVHQDVLLIGRREHVDAIRTHGLRITGKTVRLVRPRAATRIPAGEKPDLVLVGTKSYDTEAAMSHLQPFARTALFLTLQNGLDNPDLIGKTAARVVAGTTAHGVTFLGPGEICHAGAGDTTLGRWKGVDTPDVVRLRGILEEAGIPTRISKDIRSELWAKLVVNAAINPLAALAGVSNGTLVRDGNLLLLLEAVCRETAAVAAADGAQIDADGLVRRARLVARRTAGNRASMLQDFDRHRRTEIDAITGAVLRVAERRRIAAPLNRALYALAKTKERRLLDSNRARATIAKRAIPSWRAV